MRKGLWICSFVLTLFAAGFFSTGMRRADYAYAQVPVDATVATAVALTLTAYNAPVKVAEPVATAVALTLTAYSRSHSTPTPVPTPTTTPTLTVDEQIQATVTYELAGTFRGGNEDWRALYPDGVYTLFDGVPMMLVPTGCFTIGANPRDDGERNGNEICFDQPFWIDRTEVTQVDFERLGGVRAGVNFFAGPNRPADSINWLEARDFCAKRDARLPTEAEWEYAARGPDEWVYPWGNVWNADSAVWLHASSEATADVGTRPVGASWVGALDLAGNVSEWTSSLYMAYPYDASDGREANTGKMPGVRRVLRGGSWYDDVPFLRTASRYGAEFGQWYYNVGFRCARSFD